MALPASTTVAESLDRVLRLPSVCSKRFLTTKVDRHVTGACVLHLLTGHSLWVWTAQVVTDM